MDTQRVKALLTELGELTFANQGVVAKPLVFAERILPEIMDYVITKEAFVLCMDGANFKLFKAGLGENRISEHKTEIDLRELAYTIANQKILSLRLTSTKAIHGHLFTILTVQAQEEQQQRKWHFIAKNTPHIAFLFQTMTHHIGINHVEERLRRFYRLNTVPHPHSFWTNDWKSSKYLLPYDSPKGIDAITVGTFAKVIREHYQPETSLTLLDVGGGKGRVACKLLEEAERAGIKIKYILIEPDAGQCAMAKEALRAYHNVFVFTGTLQDFMVAIRNHTTSQYLALTEELAAAGIGVSTLIGDVDLIISSGGPLNAQVVAYYEAQQNAYDFFTILKSTGAVIATGLSLLLLSKKELQQIGFKVENCVAEKLNPLLSQATNFHPAYIMNKN